MSMSKGKTNFFSILREFRQLITICASAEFPRSWWNLLIKDGNKEQKMNMLKRKQIWAI